MFLFWAVAGVLAAAAAGLILIRAAGAAAEASAADPAPTLYRRQLAEIDDLAERGLMGEPERKAAQAEAGRRLLAATDAPVQVWTDRPGARHVALVAAAAPALALALYLKLGAPGVPDQPYARRLSGWEHSDIAKLAAPEVAAILRHATAQRPKEAEGFRLLGLAESASDSPIAAVNAFRKAVKLAPDRLDLWQSLAEAQVIAAGGKVDANAQATFAKVLQMSPGDPGARFYLAEAKADAGKTAEAVADLNALLAELPAGDTARRGAVQASLARIENRPALGADPQQLAMIRGMVAGLAGKLEANPDDPDGWVRLVRAYAVLGDTAKRDAAYASARARYAEKPVVLNALDEAARAEPMR